MDKYQLMNEIGRICDDRDRWKSVADRVTAERNSAWSRLMELTGTTRVGTVPEAEETIAGRLLKYAKRKLLVECATDVSDPGGGDRMLDFDAWADKSILGYMVPDELSKDDVKTVLYPELRKIYEDITMKEEDDE